MKTSIGIQGLSSFNQQLDELRPRMIVEKIGLSFENRPIYSLSWGNGPITIFMWAQMHGDEPTGSRVILNLCRILVGIDAYKGISANDIDSIQSRFTFYFIPILNPDGAYENMRFNAMGIDLNRDAKTLIAPESKILESYIHKVKPHLTLNLHDSSRSYVVSSTHKPATISFSAPCVTSDPTKVPKNRLEAMQLIYSTYCWLEEYLPGYTARYFDVYESRAFGEWIQQLGIPHILIESGGYHNDPKRLTSVDLILQSFFHLIEQVQKEGYKAHKVEDYYRIPPLSDSMFDLLYPQATIFTDDGNSFTADVALNREGDKVILEQIGDLSEFFAYERIENASFRLTELLKLRPKHLHLEMLSRTGQNQA